MKRDVCLRVRSALPEKLVQEASRRGISLAEARRARDGLTVCLGPRAARRFKSLCARYELPVDVLRVRGGGAMLAFMKRRVTLPAGVAVFLALALLALGRLWRVDVTFTGTAAGRGDAALIMEALGALGVRPGASRNIDAARLSEDLSARLPGYSYVGARVQGVRLLVEAAPELDAPELYALDDARDLYARQDGIVESVNVQAGRAVVTAGDAVRRGQLLIRGEELDRGDATRPIAALGDVMVRSWVEGRAALPLRTISLVSTGRSSAASRLSLFRWSIPLAEGEYYPEQRVETERLPVGGLFLPVEILRERRTEVRTRVEKADEAALKAHLAGLAKADARIRFCRENPGDYAILREWLEYESTGDGALSAHAVLEITTDTAVGRDALYQGGSTAWKATNNPEPRA